MLGFLMAQAESATNLQPQWIDLVSTMVPVGSQIPQECRDEASVLRRDLLRFPRARTWRWIIFCENAGWEQFLQRSGTVDRGETYASTDLERHITYLKGTTLLNPDDFRAPPIHIIGHEMGHIWLNSNDESAAERQYQRWMASARNSRWKWAQHDTAPGCIARK